MSVHEETSLIVGTVVTGFEEVALGECNSCLNVCNGHTERGKVIFEIPSCQVVFSVENLRGVDNLYVVGHHAISPDLIQSSEDKCEKLIKSFVHLVDWSEIIKTWLTVTEFNRQDECEILKPKVDRNECELEDSQMIKFRVTCNRGGTKHSFTSMEAACWFGGEINDQFGWKVDLTKFDIEVVLWINDDKFHVMAALNNSSLHRRNISHFGPTTLRPTICHNMVRFGMAQSGDIICDPMCGGGSIPIESALSFPKTFNLGGDIHERAWKRTGMNLECQKKKLSNVDSFAWNVSRLPLKNSCVDLFITDLPFGRRSGSKQDNRTLYPNALKEMARICKPGTGRAVLLTHDKRTLVKTIHTLKCFWSLKKSMYVNIGGLAAEVYLLLRTNEVFEKDSTIF